MNTSRLDEFFVPGPMPGLNDIIDWRASAYRGAYSAKKRSWQAVVSASAVDVSAWEVPAYVLIDVRERDKRRDPDNFCSGACKFLLDSLVKSGVLEGDGWKHIAGISFVWSVDKDNPGVFVSLSEAPFV